MSFIKIVFLSVLFLCSMPIFPQKTEEFKVVLDAGHGGKDPGKVAKGKIYEKDVVLKIVLLVGKKLEKHSDIKVIYTRKTDVFVDLYERGAIANKAKANLFVSVHCNAHETQVSGTETFVLGLHANEQNFEVAKTENEVIYLEDNYEKKYAAYNINSPESFIGLSIMQEEYLEQSIHFAKLLQNNFVVKMQRPNRGIKQAGFIVLHQTYMPSVLIETAFLTNNEERAFLTSEQGQDTFAENIANAILDYKKWVESKTIITEEEKFVSVSSPKKNVSASKSTTYENTASKKVKISYKVLISTSPKELLPKPFNFKGLSPISVKKSGNLNFYFYGEVSKHKEALQLLEKAKKTGYKDAYIVAYSNDKKITIEQAKKKEK